MNFVRYVLIILPVELVKCKKHTQFMYFEKTYHRIHSLRRLSIYTDHESARFKRCELIDIQKKDEEIQ